MTCQPKSVFTGCETSPTFRAKAALENSGNHFRRGEIAEIAAVVLRAVEAVFLGQIFEFLARP